MAAEAKKAPGRATVWLTRLVVLYLLTVIAVWLVLHFLGDVWWLATAALFGPRWVVAAPLCLLFPLGLLSSRRIVITLLLVAAALVVLFPVVGYTLPIRLHTPSSPRDVRVMTYNTGEIEHPDVQALVDLIGEIQPDVVTLQECNKLERGVTESFPGWNVKVDQGLCFLSRFPIKKVEARDRHDVWKMHGSGEIDRYELETPKGTIFVQNVHLATVREALGEVAHRAWKGAPAMDANIAQRSLESKLALEWAERATGPLIIAGDFNMPVDSAIYRERWSGFDNAFSVAGSGFGVTKATAWFGIRIDHVLVGPGWEILGAHVERHLGGDHRPMVADLALVDPAAAARK